MEDTPFEVNESITIDSCDDQQGGELIDAVRSVRFSIKQAKVAVKKAKDGTYIFTQLDPTFVIGPTGIDGDGKYKGKHFFGWKNLPFPGLLLAFNKDKYTSEWWNKQARFPLKMFFTALGIDPKNPPVINDEFLNGLKNRELVADITREEMSEKDGDGKYVKTGEFVNYLKNFKAVKE